MLTQYTIVSLLNLPGPLLRNSKGLRTPKLEHSLNRSRCYIGSAFTTNFTVSLANGFL